MHTLRTLERYTDAGSEARAVRPDNKCGSGVDECGKAYKTGNGYPVVRNDDESDHRAR